MAKRRTKREDDLDSALRHIAEMGIGMKEDVIDWQNIGKNAVATARNALAGKCETCGTQKPYKRLPSGKL